MVLKQYAESHKELFFCEASFPTLANAAGLQYDQPKEMKTIVYRHEWTNPTSSNIYHPVKKMAQHSIFRNRLTK